MRSLRKALQPFFSNSTYHISSNKRTRSNKRSSPIKPPPPGQSVKQAPLSNKAPHSPQLPSLSQIVEMQDERDNLHIIYEDDLEETRLTIF